MLIQTDQELRSYLPNVFATCDGEVSLFDKLNFFLSNSERWLAAYFVGDTHLATISSSSGSPLRSLCCQIVVADAFHGALPSLDLVLTPNGFGIVSNNNVAPASADRVNRLGDALIANPLHRSCFHLLKTMLGVNQNKDSISPLHCGQIYIWLRCAAILPRNGSITERSEMRLLPLSANWRKSISLMYFTAVFGSIFFRGL